MKNLELLFRLHLTKTDKTLFCICRYVFGLTHIPRLEDWPVMPVEHIGFMLMVSALLFFFSISCHRQ
jgi:Cu2+-containing amine oxidase